MRRRSLISASVAGTLLAMSAMLLMTTSAAAQDTLTVEVTETAEASCPTPASPMSTGFPTRGATFVTEGYIHNVDLWDDAASDTIVTIGL